MNILEEFWYGNIEPAEYDANTSKEYKEIVRLISRNLIYAGTHWHGSYPKMLLRKIRACNLMKRKKRKVW